MLYVRLLNFESFWPTVSQGKKSGKALNHTFLVSWQQQGKGRTTKTRIEGKREIQSRTEATNQNKRHSGAHPCLILLPSGSRTRQSNLEPQPTTLFWGNWFLNSLPSAKPGVESELTPTAPTAPLEDSCRKPGGSTPATLKSQKTTETFGRANAKAKRSLVNHGSNTILNDGYYGCNGYKPYTRSHISTWRRRYCSLLENDIPN